MTIKQLIEYDIPLTGRTYRFKHRLSFHVLDLSMLGIKYTIVYLFYNDMYKQSLMKRYN